MAKAKRKARSSATRRDACINTFIALAAVAIILGAFLFFAQPRALPAQATDAEAQASAEAERVAAAEALLQQERDIRALIAQDDTPALRRQLGDTFLALHEYLPNNGYGEAARIEYALAERMEAEKQAA